MASNFLLFFSSNSFMVRFRHLNFFIESRSVKRDGLNLEDRIYSFAPFHVHLCKSHFDLPISEFYYVSMYLAVKIFDGGF